MMGGYGLCAAQCKVVHSPVVELAQDTRVVAVSPVSTSFFFSSAFLYAGPDSIVFLSVFMSFVSI